MRRGSIRLGPFGTSLRDESRRDEVGDQRKPKQTKGGWTAHSQVGMVAAVARMIHHSKALAAWLAYGMSRHPDCPLFCTFYLNTTSILPLSHFYPSSRSALSTANIHCPSYQTKLISTAKGPAHTVTREYQEQMTEYMRNQNNNPIVSFSFLMNCNVMSAGAIARIWAIRSTVGLDIGERAPKIAFRVGSDCPRRGYDYDADIPDWCLVRRLQGQGHGHSLNNVIANQPIEAMSVGGSWDGTRPWCVRRQERCILRGGRGARVNVERLGAGLDRLERGCSGQSRWTAMGGTRAEHEGLFPSAHRAYIGRIRSTGATVSACGCIARDCVLVGGGLYKESMPFFLFFSTPLGSWPRIDRGYHHGAHYCHSSGSTGFAYKGCPSDFVGKQTARLIEADG